jgi:glycosyltransferase involved in cell wall biosynthesis
MASHRVLYVHSSAGRYGADRELDALVRALDRERVEPLVLLPFEGPLAGDLRDAGAEVIFGPLAVLRRELLTPAGLPHLAGDLRRARPAFKRLVTERGIDIVQANTSVILGLRAAAPKLVVHVHEIYPPTPVVWPLHRRQLLKADALVCASEATRAALGAGEVIYAGLAFEPRRADRTQARRALDLPDDAFVAAVPGRISGWKGQEILAQALQHPSLGAALGLFAGDAWPGQEHYEERLRTYGERMRLVGFRNDIENVYGAADVVVIPSTSPDPLPNSALEAAAAGCCVVAAAHGGLPEIITDGVTGRLFAPADADALARVVSELREDPAQRERLGTAAAADVRARFPSGRPAREFEALYDRL